MHLWWWYSAALLLIAAGAAAAFLGRSENTGVRGLGDDILARAPATTAYGFAAAPGLGAQGQSVVASVASSGQSARPTASAAPMAPPLDPGTQRMVRSAEITLDLAAGAFPSAFDRVAVAATEHGGFVVSSTSESEGSGQIVLRVPVVRFDAAREAVARLGKVERQSIRGDDASATLVDQDARLRSLQVQEEALRALVGKAATVSEVLQVQPTLFNVRQQIEQLQAQRASLEQAAALATISVALYEPGTRAPVAPPVPNEFRRRLDQAGDGAVSVVGAMIVVVGWLAPVAAPGLVALVAMRLRRRRLAAP